MNSGWQVLDRAFAQLGAGHPLVAAVLVLFCAALVICTVAFAARRIRPTRREERRLVSRPVRVSWHDRTGFAQSEDGLCQDVSTGGMALELPFPLKTRTQLSLRVAESRLSCAGVVHRCTPAGPHYVIGVKFDRQTRSLMKTF